jgi:hypothetical protein
MNKSIGYLAIIILLGIALIRNKAPVEPNFADWDRVRDCELAVGQFADRGTDLWYEQMEQCVHLDADYLNVPFQREEQ